MFAKGVGVDVRGNGVLILTLPKNCHVKVESQLTTFSSPRNTNIKTFTKKQCSFRSALFAVKHNQIHAVSLNRVNERVPRFKLPRGRWEAWL